MTWKDLRATLGNLIYQSPKRRSLAGVISKEDAEIKVFFDFPPNGINTQYSISKVTEDGIMLRNNEVERPLGH